MIKKSDFYAVATIAAFYGCLFLLGITCPIKFLTGISCPGCGMTRAWISAACLQFSDALYFHPLFWSAPILLILSLWRRPKRQGKWIMWIIVLLFLITYVYRLFAGDGDVVVWEPANGFILRWLRSCFLGG